MIYIYRPSLEKGSDQLFVTSDPSAYKQLIRILFEAHIVCNCTLNTLEFSVLYWTVLDWTERFRECRQAQNPGESFKLDTRALCGQMSESVSQ